MKAAMKFYSDCRNQNLSVSISKEMLKKYPSNKPYRTKEGYEVFKVFA